MATSTGGTLAALKPSAVYWILQAQQPAEDVQPPGIQKDMACIGKRARSGTVTRGRGVAGKHTLGSRSAVRWPCRRICY